MAIQTGISIAAIAIAIVAIGVSASMVSSIGQDMTELKSTIEELSQTQSRGAIDQQAFAPPKLGEPTSKLHDSIQCLYCQLYEPEFAKRVQGMHEVIDILVIAELDDPLTNQDKQSMYKFQKMIEAGTMKPKLFNSIKSVIKDISTENDLSYDCQDLSGNLGEFGTETELGAEDKCPPGESLCPRYGLNKKCCDGCITGTCIE